MQIYTTRQLCGIPPPVCPFFLACHHHMRPRRVYMLLLKCSFAVPSEYWIWNTQEHGRVHLLSLFHVPAGRYWKTDRCHLALCSYYFDFISNDFSAISIWLYWVNKYSLNQYQHMFSIHANQVHNFMQICTRMYHYVLKPFHWKRSFYLFDIRGAKKIDLMTWYYFKLYMIILNKLTGSWEIWLHFTKVILQTNFRDWWLKYLMKLPSYDYH